MLTWDSENCAMTTSSEKIRTVLRPYLVGSIELPEVLGTLLPLLENADTSSKEMSESVEGLLALRAAGNISEESLKAQLRSLMPSHFVWGAVMVADSASGTVTVLGDPESVVSGTSTVRLPDSPFALAGIGRAKVYA